jgi:hypothetical protein
MGLSSETIQIMPVWPAEGSKWPLEGLGGCRGRGILEKTVARLRRRESSRRGRGRGRGCAVDPWLSLLLMHLQGLELGVEADAWETWTRHSLGGSPVPGAAGIS